MLRDVEAQIGRETLKLNPKKGNTQIILETEVKRCPKCDMKTPFCFQPYLRVSQRYRSVIARSYFTSFETDRLS
jgi:hypothetical protein